MPKQQRQWEHRRYAAHRGRLQREPQERPRTLPELFTLLQAMERASADRYRELARSLRTMKDQRLALLFEELADEEARHATLVEEWSRSATGAVAEAYSAAGDRPEAFGAGDDQDLSLRTLTPYQVLAMAVRNEERAFAYWSYVSAHAGDRRVKQVAEAVANEELAHAARLRTERRRAYHARVSDSGKPEEAFGPSSPSAAQPLRAALAVELRLEAALRARASGQDDAGSRELHALLVATEDLIARITGVLGSAQPAAEEASDAVSDEDWLLVGCERVVDHYFELADQAPSEAMLSAAHTLAQHAIDRLARLRILCRETQGQRDAHIR